MKSNQKKIKQDLRSKLSELKEIRKMIDWALVSNQKRDDIIVLFDQVKNFIDLTKAFMNSPNKKFSLVYMRMIMDIVYQIEQYRMTKDEYFFTKIDNQSLYKKGNLDQRNHEIKSGEFGQEIFNRVIGTEKKLELLTKDSQADIIDNESFYKVYQNLSDYVHMNPMALRFANRRISEKHDAYLLFAIHLTEIIPISIAKNETLETFFKS